MGQDSVLEPSLQKFGLKLCFQVVNVDQLIKLY